MTSYYSQPPRQYSPPQPPPQYSPPPQYTEQPTQVLPVIKAPVEPEAAAAPPAAGKPRNGWADIAKGICIVLVVLWHVIMKHYLQIDWHLSLPIPGAWGTFGNELLPLRMPVFFTISGMFAANAAMRPWSVVARSRIAKFYYLYVVWFTVHTLVLSLVPGFDTLNANSVLDVLEQLTITPTNLWYLIALAWYFVFAKLTRTWPVYVVLGAAFILSAIGSAGWLASPGNRGQMYQNLLFFVAGLRLKPLVEKLAKEATLRMLVLGAVGYLGVMAVIQVLGAKQWFGVWPVASGVAVLIGVAAAAQLQRWRWLAVRLESLGQNTLPIYVMHMPLLALFHLAFLHAFSGLGPGPQLVLAVILPPLLTGLLVALCLYLHKGLRAAHAGWLFELPGKRTKATPPPAQSWADAPTRILPVVR
jgi:uncharacterized membrane protein YcfT